MVPLGLPLQMDESRKSAWQSCSSQYNFTTQHEAVDGRAPEGKIYFYFSLADFLLPRSLLSFLHSYRGWASVPFPSRSSFSGFLMPTPAATIWVPV